jgi:AhpD family alkylhydroperoxidase
MAQRIGWAKAAPRAYKAMFSLHEYLGHCGLEQELLNLVYLRASQINGCAFCIDMHWKDLRTAGVSEQHLYMLNA